MAKGGAEVAIESIEHLRRYIELLFKKEKRTRRKEKGTGRAIAVSRRNLLAVWLSRWYYKAWEQQDWGPSDVQWQSYQ
jgi:hypothetical protein